MLAGDAMAKITVRKGMPSVQLDKQEFKKRFLARFYDPDYDPLRPELDKLVDAAWITYDEYHKSPRTGKPARSSPIPASICRSNGSKRGRMCGPPNANRKIRKRPRAS